jgi:hypothetical protein
MNKANILFIIIAIFIISCDSFDKKYIEGNYYLMSYEYSDIYYLSYYVGSGYVGIAKPGIKKYCHDDEYIFLQYGENEYYLVQMCEDCIYTAEEGVTGSFTKNEFKTYLEKLKKREIEFEEI